MNYFKTALLLASMTALFMGVGFMLGGTGGMVIAFVIAVGMNAFPFRNSGSMALRMHGAQAATRASHPELFKMVEEMAEKANLPMPGVYVIPSPQPNAFATGRSPANAAVAATTGIMDMLSKEELAGVMAHELAHVKNRDTLIMTVAATVAGAISMLAQFGMFMGGRRDNPLGIVGVLLAVIFAPMAAMVIQMLISRTREYSADKLGAEICGNPGALASALARISSGASRVEMVSAENNPSTAHLFIVNPLSGARMDNLFSTHPSMENRIAALQKQAQEMGTGWPQSLGRAERIPSVRRKSGPWS
jgi:heat shock protein HtpX